MKSLKIIGKRIYLRRIELNDVSDIYVQWLNDPEINKFLETRYRVQTIHSVREFVEETIKNKNILFLAICTNDSSKHIGNIKLGPINIIHKFAEMSLFIGEKNQWGKGLATEAISILTNYAFKNLKLNKINAGCYSENKGSERAFLKSGYESQGALKNQWIVDGKYQDDLSFGLWIRDWENQLFEEEVH